MQEGQPAEKLIVSTRLGLQLRREPAVGSSR